MSIFGAGSTAPPPPIPPPAPPPPPAFGMSPQGQKPKQKSQQTTFLGEEAVPTQSANLGYKTLLGV